MNHGTSRRPGLKAYRLALERGYLTVRGFSGPEYMPWYWNCEENKLPLITVHESQDRIIRVDYLLGFFSGHALTPRGHRRLRRMVEALGGKLEDPGRMHHGGILIEKGLEHVAAKLLVRLFQNKELLQSYSPFTHRRRRARGC